MNELTSDDRRRLRRLRAAIGYGESLSQADLDELAREWAVRTEPGAEDESERFAVTRLDGSTTGVSGPRWLFHLFGLAHRASHVGFHTRRGVVVLQRRAVTKRDWPEAWDMAVAGHVPQREDGSEMTFEEGAVKEIEEEAGLPGDRLAALLAEGRLLPIGAPYFSFECDERRNPPFYNAEIRQIYAATLTDEGVAALRPDEEELSGLFLCTVKQAWDTLSSGNVASGLRFSLPRYLDWLERNRSRQSYV
jgi:isopentenyldiphosphate isomerase